MICIYHNRDFDGFCSAAIVKRKYPDTKFIGWDYGLPIPELPEGEPVIMVDISFPMEDMLKVARNSHWNLTWIDHHKSAIEDWEKFTGKGEAFCNARLDWSIAACEGTWNEFFNDRPTPDIVKFLGIYDTWRGKNNVGLWNEVILPLQYGLKTVCNSLDTFPMDAFESNLIADELIEKGDIILKYQDMQNEARCKNSAFERVFEGLRAICLIGVIGSQSFKSIWDPEKYDIMIAASFQNEKWTVSIYSEKSEIDCSAICKMRGGGGHKGAAGFIADDIKIITG